MASSHRRMQKPVRGRGSTKCPDHQGKDVVYKCADCNGLACVECATTIHRGHALDGINDTTPEVTRKLQTFIKSCEEDEIPRLKSKLHQVGVDLTRNRQYYDNLIEEIKKQNDLLKDKFDDITKSFVKTCRDMQQGSEDLLLKHKTDLQTMIDELNSQINDCKDALLSGNDIQVHDISNDINLQYTDVPPAPSSTAIFTAAKVTSVQLEKIFGQISFSSVVTSKWEVSTTFTPLKEYFARSMHRGLGDTVWTSVFNPTSGKYSGTMWQYNLANRTQMGADVKTNVYDFSVSPKTGNILFLSTGDKKVRVRHAEDGKLSELFKASTEPLSICATADGHVVIGQTCYVGKYTETGKMVSQTHFTGQDSFIRFPYHISECPVTGQLAIVDRDWKVCGGNEKPFISILGNELQLLYQYFGTSPGQPPLKNTFDPRDVAYTNEGTLLVADGKNKSLFLLNGRGEYLQTLYINNNSSLSAVSVHMNGQICVSVYDQTVYVLTRKQ